MIQYNFKINTMFDDLFVREIVAYIQQIVPYLILNRTAFNPIYLISIPFFIKLFQYIWQFLKARWKHTNLVSITLINRKTWRTGEYNIYIRVAWYLSRYLETNSNVDLESDYSTSSIGQGRYCDGREETEAFEPMYKPVQNGETIICKYKNHDLQIQLAHQTDLSETGSDKVLKNSVLIISYHDITIIKEFIKHCQAEYIAHMTQVNTEKYQYNQWRPDNKWEIDKIKTVKTFENIFLAEKLQTDILKHLESFYESRDFYKKNGIPYKKGLLFYGKPGCGKSSTIYAITNKYDKNIFYLNLHQFDNVSKLKEAVSQIENNSIVVIEDIDCFKSTHCRVETITGKSKDDTKADTKSDTKADTEKIDPKSQTNLEIFQFLLEMMDGYNYLEGSVIIFTTNHLEKIDEALIRPGRIDHKFYFDTLDLQTTLDIYQNFYELAKTQLQAIKTYYRSNISSAELINNLILPHRNDFKTALKKYIKFGQLRTGELTPVKICGVNTRGRSPVRKTPAQARGRSPVRVR